MSSSYEVATGARLPHNNKEWLNSMGLFAYRYGWEESLLRTYRICGFYRYCLEAGGLCIEILEV